MISSPDSYSFRFRFMDMERGFSARTASDAYVEAMLYFLKQASDGDLP